MYITCIESCFLPDVSGIQSGMKNLGLQGGNAEVYFGTVVLATNFNAEKDSEMLRKAMKGIGILVYLITSIYTFPILVFSTLEIDCYLVC